MKLIKKSKFKKTAIIAGIVVLALLLPQVAKADILSNILGSVGKDILITLGQAAHYVLNWLLKAAAAVFSGVLDIGFDSNIVGVAKIGWTVTRNFANMFFILFLVIIAFTTILRLPRYGIKDLLPKVIIVALLINFSFVIASVIIDFSNITADFFIKDIKNKIGGEKKGIVSVTFVDSLNVAGVFVTYADCREFFDQEVKKCASWQNTWKEATPFLGPALFSLNKCLEKAGKLAEQCEKYGSITVKDDSYASDANFLELFLSITAGIIVLLIATFVLFAGAIMLLIRIIALWILIVIVPLAFICIIMPALRRNWQQWWSAFLKWCFFAPIYAFFIWMAIQISILQIHNLIAASTNATTPGNWGPGTNPFTADPGTQIISYGIIIAFLVGGLIAAQKLSIYGASTAMAIGQKWGRAAANKAARYPKEIGAALTGEAVKGMGKGLQRIPGFRAFGERMEARGKIIAQKPLRAEEVKKAEEMFKQMSPEQLAHQIKTQISGAMTHAAAKVAYERGDFVKNKDKAAADIAAKTFRAYGDIKTAEDIEKSRADVIEDDKKQYDTLKEMKDKGELNKLSAIALEDEKVVSKLTMLGVDFEKLREISNKHAENLKTTLANITNPVNQANMIARGINPLAKEIQHAYASQTGDIKRMTPAQRAFFGRDAGPEGLKRITSVTPEIINAIPTTKLKSIIDKIEKDVVAKDIIRAIKANPAHPAYQIVIRDRYLNNLA